MSKNCNLESPWKNGLEKFSFTQNILIAISILFISFMVKIYCTYGESDYSISGSKFITLMVSHFLHFSLIFITFIAVITFMGDTFMGEQ